MNSVKTNTTGSTRKQGDGKPIKSNKKRAVRFQEEVEVHEVENWKDLNILVDDDSSDKSSCSFCLII